MMDTGSSVNLIPRKLFEKHFSVSELQKCDQSFSDYSGAKLKAHDKILLQMSWQDRTSIEEVTVTERR